MERGNRPGSTSCGMSPVGARPAGVSLGCGKRRAGPRSPDARDPREVSLAESAKPAQSRCKRPPGSQFGRKRQGGALGGRGYLGGKKYLQICHRSTSVEVHPKGHPRGRWLHFESPVAEAQQAQAAHTAQSLHRLQTTGLHHTAHSSRTRPPAGVLQGVVVNGGLAMWIGDRGDRPVAAAG
jgi:hypothetical protein